MLRDRLNEIATTDDQRELAKHHVGIYARAYLSRLRKLYTLEAEPVEIVPSDQMSTAQAAR